MPSYNKLANIYGSDRDSDAGVQVGWACSHFSHIYRRSRGMYFCRHDRHEMASMVYNWESDEVGGSSRLGMATCLTPLSRLTRWW